LIGARQRVVQAPVGGSQQFRHGRDVAGMALACL